jgi:ribosome-binding protein aMBF1 (putative translation factor)
VSALDKYTEAVALAQREVYVAEALLSEHRGKLRLAEEEVSDSNRRLETAQNALSRAAVEAHEAVHGKPVSFDDRMEFEKRWDARVDAARAKKALYEADMAAKAKAKQDLLDEVNEGFMPAAEVRAAVMNAIHPDNGRIDLDTPGVRFPQQ